MKDIDYESSDSEYEDELAEYNSEEEYEDDIEDESDESEDEVEDEQEDEQEDEVEDEIGDEEDEVEDEQQDEVEDDDEDEDLNVDMFDDRQVYQARKREFKLDRNKISNQINRFKFVNMEKDEIIKKEMTNFTPSEKNINIFCNSIKCEKTNAVDILRNMFYNDDTLKQMLDEIRNGNTIFNSKKWDENRETIKKEVIALQTKIEVIDSFISCPKCKQKKIQFYNVQLRRADEPPTTFNNCMNKDCLYSWRTG